MKREPELLPVKTPRSHPSAPAPAPVPPAPTYSTPAGRKRMSLYLATSTAEVLEAAASELFHDGRGKITKGEAYEALIHCGVDNAAAAYKRLGIKHG